MTQVLITRPLESSQLLAEQLDALGINSIIIPMYTFSPRDPELDMKSAWSAPARRRLAVFTSPRAVQYGLSHIPKNQLNGLEYAVIGSATRATLESSGCPVHLQADNGYRSEDLLQIPELASEPGEVVIFCAPGGRETLSIGLAELGWDVAKAKVYERVPLAAKPEQIVALSAAEDLLSVWTSISALKIAEEHLPGALWLKILNAPALVISVRIQHHLQQLGATRVELSDGPGNADLLQSILGWTEQ